MKVVIDIPEETYNLITTQWKRPKYIGAERLIYEWVTEGKLLPKGHGRILDEKDILDTKNNDGDWYDLFDMPAYIAGVKAIIEADKGESEK